MPGRHVVVLEAPPKFIERKPAIFWPQSTTIIGAVSGEVAVAGVLAKIVAPFPVRSPLSLVTFPTVKLDKTLTGRTVVLEGERMYFCQSSVGDISVVEAPIVDASVGFGCH